MSTTAGPGPSDSQIAIAPLGASSLCLFNGAPSQPNGSRNSDLIVLPARLHQSELQSISRPSQPGCRSKPNSAKRLNVSLIAGPPLM